MFVRPAHWGAIAAALGLLGACGSQSEGIVVVISTADDINVDRLRVAVGPDLATPVRFAGPGGQVIDAPEPTHVHDVLRDGFVELGGRNLRKDPYRVFLRGGNPEGLGVMVEAADPELTGRVGHLRVRSEPGIVREYELILERPENYVSSERCMRAWSLANDPSLLVATFGGDFDCDGADLSEGDCADHDGTIGPFAMDFCEKGARSIDNNCNGQCDEDDELEDGSGVAVCGTLINSPNCERGGCANAQDGEICDGGDTDCNPLSHHFTNVTPCFQNHPIDGDCAIGMTSCEEDEGEQGTGTFNSPDCDTVMFEFDTPLPRAFCDKYVECIMELSVRATDCTYEKLGSEFPTFVCNVEYDAAQDQICPLKVDLEPQLGPCNVSILDPRFEGPFVELTNTDTPDCPNAALSISGPREQGDSPSSFELLVQRGDNTTSAVGDYARYIFDVYEVEGCMSSATTNPCRQRR